MKVLSVISNLRRLMLLNNASKRSASIEDHLYQKIKKYGLKNRAMNACCDNTDYQLRLKNLMSNNKNNLRLLTKITGYMEYLKRQGMGIQQASKETLELIDDPNEYQIK